MHKINNLKLATLLLLIATLLSCNKSSDSNFTINGVVNGIEDGRKISLKIQDGRKIITIDSVQAKDGKFIFKGMIDEPTQFGIFIDDIKYGIFPIIDKKESLLIEVQKDSMHKTKFTGSKLQDQLNAMYAEKEEFSKKTQPLFSEYQIAQKANDKVKMDEINAKFKALQGEISLKDWNFIKENKDSYLTPIILRDLMRDPTFRDSCKVGFNNLADKVKNSKLAAQIKNYYIKQDSIEKAKLESAKKKVKELTKKNN